MSSKTAAKVTQAVLRVQPVHKKYTVQSTGIWERIRRLFAVDPTRSNGVPLNPQYRNPPPGSNDPLSFQEPVTLPAGDIAGNPYWKRDARRNYPQLSFVTQGDVVGLLSLGSQASPKKELIGDAGSQALVQVQEEGKTGLAAYFKKDASALAMLGKDGLPPLPSGSRMVPYALTGENAYPDKYPCRTFQ